MITILDDTTSEEKCPYSEPTASVKRGSKGEGAKWVQWYLQKIINPELVVDGDFGSKSAAALRVFQTKYGLAVDGICGPATRTKMKKVLEVIASG